MNRTRMILQGMLAVGLILALCNCWRSPTVQIAMVHGCAALILNAWLLVISVSFSGNTQ